jgi:cell wall-associated NlpC family hydrolase
VVLAHDLMGAKDPTSFRPADPLTRSALDNVAAALAPAPPAAASTAPPPSTTPAPSANPDQSVTIAQLDARLVQLVGLSDVASQFARSARAAGLKIPARFGTEMTARLLGLRTNHPAAQDKLELLPDDPATRAEAAYSVAQILGFHGWEGDELRGAATTFELPTYTPWQQRVLDTAVKFIGYPYIWAGESETTKSPFGTQVQGGFDCSGFVWRVYKLQPYPDEGELAATLKGRTTYQISGEVPKAQRIALDDLQPADVIFFGARGPKSKPAQVDHMGIYLGNGWFIHSSGYGVAVAQLSGWYSDRFAWGRRPLAEAGALS